MFLLGDPEFLNKDDKISRLSQFYRSDAGQTTDVTTVTEVSYMYSVQVY